MPHPETPSRRGPKTPEGKARSAMNALRHGLRARHFALLPHEDPAEFAALARATREAYRPRCPVERELVEAIAVALWREIRADRIEAEALADIPPADTARTTGTDLLEPTHRASLALVLRYRAQAAAAVRRAQDALARHRALSEAAERTVEPAAPRPAEAAETQASAQRSTAEAASEPVVDRTNEFPETDREPPRLALRDAVRKAVNPLDTPLLRALGRDPDLVLPVPGLVREAWPLAQHKAVPGAPGLEPYRRVPHLPYGEWAANQHLLAEMVAAARAKATPPAAPSAPPSETAPAASAAPVARAA